MPHDPRPRYDILQPITFRNRFAWIRVGTGYRNSDGTIDAYLDVIVHGHRFRLREEKPDEQPKPGCPDPEKESRHGA